MPNPVETDVAVIGGGMAGVSLAASLAPHLRVVVLERESQPGYHTTGRSAAMYVESYGPPPVRALTLASGGFFRTPPEGFAEPPILTPRPVLTIADLNSRDGLDQREQVFRDLGIAYRRLAPQACEEHAPALRAELLSGGLLELTSADMDVHALLHGFLRQMRRAGGELVCSAEVRRIEANPQGWLVSSSAQTWRCRLVVNAAGAWADSIAHIAGARPLGLEPRRRTAFTFAPPAGVDVRAWPVMLDVNECWYVKPDAGMLLGTPANADPAPAHDVRPEDMDIAVAIERIEQMTRLTIRRPAHAWAGLRTFAPDGELVGGFDSRAPGFFWCAGQGGYGIQSAPAMARTCAAIILGRPIPEDIARLGVTAEALSPRRFD